MLMNKHHKENQGALQKGQGESLEDFKTEFGYKIIFQALEISQSASQSNFKKLKESVPTTDV